MVAAGGKTFSPRSVASKSEPSGMMLEKPLPVFITVRGFAHNVSYVKLI
jgi:hypothetical protein